MTVDSRTVSQAGEDAMVAAICQIIDPHNAEHAGLLLGPGDDAAVLSCTSGQPVLTTDTLSADQDYRRTWWEGRPMEEWPRDLGTKAAAQNLSDLNAMGATPIALLVSLTLPPEFTVQWVQDFYAGVVRACSQPGAMGCAVAGGDLGSGADMSVTITAVGEPHQPGRLLRRSGARPGDILGVCGRLGYAAAGLALLEQAVASADRGAGLEVQGAAAGLLAECLEAQKRPQPPLTAGAAALRAGATAGMDLSDGLLRDAGRLARASEVKITLDEAALNAEARSLEPVAQHCEGAPYSAASDWVVSGGEDFGLLATFPSPAELPEGFRIIGHVAETAPGESAGAVLPGWTGAPGWDSMRG
ncbi:thiamine-phosphate kinase [Nesterenkonia natronophila]|nr:thiamine-phosphate kinase [Nesterenkonia natronophila]